MHGILPPGCQIDKFGSFSSWPALAQAAQRDERLALGQKPANYKK
jgi:hypothetical protein